MIKRWDLRDFIAESNRIEQMADVLPHEVEAHKELLSHNHLEVEHLKKFVSVIAPGHYIRDRQNCNVTVGSYHPPTGGPNIPLVLAQILDEANMIRNGHFDYDTPWGIHVRYEKLHPFTDGNGRSGRALWLWMHHGKAPIGFLHQFYYETLQAMGNK